MIANYRERPRYTVFRAIRVSYGRLVAGLGVKKDSSDSFVSSCLRCLKSETQFETVETISRAAAFFETCFAGAGSNAGLASPFFITFTLVIIAWPPCSLLMLINDSLSVPNCSAK